MRKQTQPIQLSLISPDPSSHSSCSPIQPQKFRIHDPIPLPSNLFVPDKTTYLSNRILKIYQLYTANTFPFIYTVIGKKFDPLKCLSEKETIACNWCGKICRSSEVLGGHVSRNHKKEIEERDRNRENSIKKEIEYEEQERDSEQYEQEEEREEREEQESQEDGLENIHIKLEQECQYFYQQDSSPFLKQQYNPIRMPSIMFPPSPSPLISFAPPILRSSLRLQQIRLKREFEAQVQRQIQLRMLESANQVIKSTEVMFKKFKKDMRSEK